MNQRKQYKRMAIISGRPAVVIVERVHDGYNSRIEGDPYSAGFGDTIEEAADDITGGDR